MPQVVNPSGVNYVTTEIEIFNGVSPNPAAWTDLDTGIKNAIVVLRCYNSMLAGNNRIFAFRRNGETQYLDIGGGGLIPNPFSCYVNGTTYQITLGITDQNGITEWYLNQAGQAGITIDLIGYRK